MRHGALSHTPHFSSANNHVWLVAAMVDSARGVRFHHRWESWLGKAVITLGFLSSLCQPLTSLGVITTILEEGRLV